VAEKFARIYGRVAVGAAFLSAVASRFGLWTGEPALESFRKFIRYTSQVLSFVPPATVPFFAVTATAAETFLGVALIAGFRLRWTGMASAVLLALFGTSMAVSFGLKSPLEYSVFSASAAALLLAVRSPK